MPAYNEERFIGTLIERIRAVDLSPVGFAPELIVVDDGSRDRTAEIAGRIAGVKLIRKPNGGKGSAVRAGIQSATGDYLMIQDADLEYDPRDYVPMLEAVVTGRAPIVYGSRYLKHPASGTLKNLLTGKHPQQSLAAYLGGQSLSFVALLYTRRYLTDTVTALKLFPRELLVDLRLESSGFELDHEITAKVLARGWSIVEIPIRYYPRSRAEGKKIGLRDWFRAIRTFHRFRRDTGGGRAASVGRNQD
jgi:glycosyltransferase involved in cell wall biosynthesis